MAYLTRKDWGAPALRGNALRTTDPKNRRGFVVHWDGGRNPKDAADEIRLLKAYHNHHNTPTRGGFPYNLAVGPVTGNVYEGRGLDKIGAHAGGSNTPNLGVIVIGGPGNLTDAAKRGLQEAYQIANAYAGRTLTRLVHSDVNSTSCPGDAIRKWVKAGGLTDGSPAGGGGDPTPVPTPVIPIESEEDEMKPKIIFRNTGNPEWSLVHPDYRGPSELERGYLVTTNENRAIAWARLHGNGWGTPGTYTASVNRDGYIEIQAAARAEYDAKVRAAEQPTAAKVVSA